MTLVTGESNIKIERKILIGPPKLTRFEKARIVGARALQISMGAPSIIKIPKELISPIDIAMLEFKEDAIPITVKRVENN